METVVGKLFPGSYDDIKVNDLEAQDIENVYRSSSIHAACTSIILRALFEKGFEFYPKRDLIPDPDSSSEPEEPEATTKKKNAKKVKTKKEVEKPENAPRLSRAHLDKELEFLYMKIHYEPVVKAALLDCIKFGYAVISMELHTCEWTGLKRFRPINVNRALVHIFGKFNDESMSVKWYAKRRNDYIGRKKSMPLHIVIPTNEYSPDEVTGKHRSSLALTMSDIDYVRRLEFEHLNGTVVRATPIVIFEHNMEAIKFSKDSDDKLPTMPDLRRNYNFDPEEPVRLGRTRGDAKKVTNALEDSLELANQSTQLSAYSAQNLSALRNRKYDTDSENTRTLPPNLKVAQTQPHVPAAQTEIIRHQEALREAIVTMYGIPPAMVMFAHNAGQKQSVRTADVQDALLFKRTVTQHENAAIFILNSIYRFLTGNTILFKDIPFKAIIDTSQLAQPEQLYRAHSQGFISKETCQRNVLDSIGLSEFDAATEEVRIEKPPINGTERQTTAQMEAQVRLMLADAKNKEADAKKKIAETEGNGKENKMELELADKQYKLKELEINGQLQILDKTMEVKRLDLQVKAKQAKDKAVQARKKAKTR